MRDRYSWYKPIADVLDGFWPPEIENCEPKLVCQVELGLRVLELLDRDEPAGGAWTLLSGYPFARAAGLVPTPDAERMLICARHLLSDLRRRHSWREALKLYRTLPGELRMYDVPADLGASVRTESFLVYKRLQHYDDALREPPVFMRNRMSIAAAGPHFFLHRNERIRLDVPEELTALPAEPMRHDLDTPTRSNGAPIDIPRRELEDTAAWLEQREAELAAEIPEFRPRQWLRQLTSMRFDNWHAGDARFREEPTLRIDRLLHMVGMVGTGKSTLMLLVAVWAALREPSLQITLVVGDVAEQLRLTNQLRMLLGNEVAAPVIGQSTRQRHIEGLHRRLAAQGRNSILNHSSEDGFDSLSTACPLDATRRGSSGPLRLGAAPCHSLRRLEEDESDPGQLAADDLPPTRGCPIWHHCPRNHASRSLTRASIWIANPASLVASPVSPHMSQKKLRHLELACLRSDIVIIDEADRVMMNLDTTFAPSATLVTRGVDSWLDLLHTHSIRELAREGRLQLSDHYVQRWEAALGVVTLATNRLYSMLINNAALRGWVDLQFFNSWTLQEKLLEEWFPAAEDQHGLPGPVGSPGEEWDFDSPGRERGSSDSFAPESGTRAHAGQVLDQFRDDPTGDSGPHGTLADAMASAVQQLLHADNPSSARNKVAELVAQLRPRAPRPEPEYSDNTAAAAGESESAVDDDAEWKLRFTLLLSALHQRLDRLTHLWPQVEAALRLDAADNALARRPPLDYMPLVPEAPMGNLLGFQFLPDGEENEGQRVTGTVRFFRCAGVGRELLAGLPDLGGKYHASTRSGPNVLLMSGTSWAGTSTRSHLPVPVRTILRPTDEARGRVLETEFVTRFLYHDGEPVRLSGLAPKTERPAVLRMMIDELGRSSCGAQSKLAEEIDLVDDPDRHRALLLVGSYQEAEVAAAQLNDTSGWRGSVRPLIPDNDDLGEAAASFDGDAGVTGIRRGDVADFASDPSAKVLVAPLLAVERGHNILNGDVAAFGVVLFLARPHPVPDDITLSVFAINDWAARFVRGSAGQPRHSEEHRTFDELVASCSDLDRAGSEFRSLARERWGRLLVRPYAYRALPEDERRAFAWDQLVTIWQVIGRLVRGGVPARVVFVDAAFAPNLAKALAPGAEQHNPVRRDTAKTSLLVNLREILAPYFDDEVVAESLPDPADKEIASRLYEPVYRALCKLLDKPIPQRGC